MTTTTFDSTPEPPPKIGPYVAEACACCGKYPIEWRYENSLAKRPTVAGYVRCSCGHAIEVPANQEPGRVWNKRQTELQAIKATAVRCRCGGKPRIWWETKEDVHVSCRRGSCGACVVSSTVETAIKFWNKRQDRDSRLRLGGELLEPCRKCQKHPSCISRTMGSFGTTWHVRCSCGAHGTKAKTEHQAKHEWNQQQQMRRDLRQQMDQHRAEMLEHHWNLTKRALRLAPVQYQQDFTRLLHVCQTVDGDTTVLAECALCGHLPHVDQNRPWCSHCDVQRSLSGLYPFDGSLHDCADIWNKQQADRLYGSSSTLKIDPAYDTIKVAGGRSIKYAPETTIRVSVNKNKEGKDNRMTDLNNAIRCSNDAAANAVKDGVKQALAVQALAVQAQQAIVQQVKQLLGDSFPEEFYGTPIGKAVLDLGACYLVHAAALMFPQVPMADKAQEYAQRAMVGVTAQNVAPLMTAAQQLIAGVVQQAEPTNSDEPQEDSK